MSNTWSLSPDRCFSPEPSQRALARELYISIKDLPLICPHGHVDPTLLSDPQAQFGTPADLFIIPDHYVFRMLYSQGVLMEDLGVPTRDGTPVEQDHRQIWQRFAEHFYLFRGTPTGMWLADELTNVFGVTEKLNGANAQTIYDQLETVLQQPEYSPRALFKRFNIEVLCTTDAATDTLQHHSALQQDGWTQVRPTFRPDAIVNLSTTNWHDHLQALNERSQTDITSYATLVQVLEERRAFFKKMGATATDHAAVTPYTARLSDAEAEAIFARALNGQADATDATRFTGHMLIEMARMSVDDGLVMQLHVGSWRNHNTTAFNRFGPDKGADIPVQTEWTRNLQPLLNAYGSAEGFRLILFTLDESTYSRELAPLAGHYPAVLLGPPWWFHDSFNGMQRYLDQVTETAGLYNLAGFNDDTRAFASIPARHEVWRRACSNWLAGLVVMGFIDDEDAHAMAYDCAYGLAKRAYNL
ncbi:MAG: glucuronate isomerase [Chloroflexi bacterium AL-W]|nr:glucuronate isomerase [Chloroflexi bacterium AL-N1]NOK66565.1 glucuronate isomerase [Chloroflexi bacterium AL-N10]NOK71953.1 glucuronate isomerase [Chloroflexi bacterium AL-N5]NOK81210.1 glucuronate isomerase [Chloroflexi bacterium AL-W]NOK89483.1 glucuronate isomerase [Chloroflexi bacterium AL-N15]